MRRAWLYAGILGSAAILGLAAPKAVAWSGGISGFSGNPAINLGAICTDCHSGGIAPSVSFAGPTLVSPGSSTVYQFRITGGQSDHGGFDVSATGGTLLDSEMGTRLENGEVTHTAPRPASSGRVIFSFTWQAPAAPGTYTLYGAGNSVNFNGSPLGDNAAATSLQVTVEAASATPGETSDPAALQPVLVTGYDNLTGDISISYESGCNTDDNNIYYGPLNQVSTLGYTGEVCAVGTAGTAAFDPGAGSFFFLVVGNQGTAEGSYGKGVGGAERFDFPGNLCGEAQDLSNSCTP